MNSKNLSKISSITFGVLTLAFLIGFYALAAWQEPTAQPPEGNVAVPINVSGVDQCKEYKNDTDAGRLGIATDGVDTGFGMTVGNASDTLGIKVAGSSLFEYGTTTINELVVSNGLTLGGEHKTEWPTSSAPTEVCKLVGYDYDTICSVPVKAGDEPCPIWKDCDGDGYTYGNGDCDESCPTCYVGSTSYTTSPDGRDQDCDGVIDEEVSGVGGYDSSCVWRIGNYYNCQPAAGLCPAGCTESAHDYRCCKSADCGSATCGGNPWWAEPNFDAGWGSYYCNCTIYY